MNKNINLNIILLIQLISSTLSSVLSSNPLSFHDIVVVKPSQDAVIRLRGYDLDGDQLTFSITQTPSTGKLFQLSQVYSAYGYEPKDGTVISSTPVVVTGSKSRVYYRRPTPDVETNNKWGTFSYIVNDGKTNSYAGIITLVPPSGALVGSNFLLSNEGWTINGNKVSSSPTKHEPYSRGRLLNQYVLGTEDKINVMSKSSEDNSLWFFSAPSTFLGNQGISYGGKLQFTLGSFSGDFNNLNSHAPLVRLVCADCQGPIYKGITLIFPLSTALQSTTFSRDGTTFSFNLQETSGWLKDPQNSLKKWTVPTKCDMIQVLSRLTSLEILGDWTTWYETMALDNVQILNTKTGQIPVCAMSRPDASICTCDTPLPG